MEKNKKENEAFIQKLIQEEEDAAFRILTKEGLISRLEERIKAQASKKTMISRWINRPWPAFVYFLLITVVLVLALLLSPPRQKKAMGALETYLQTTPGIQTLTKMTERSDYRQTFGKTKSFFLAENIENFLDSTLTEECSTKEETAFLKYQGESLSFDLEEKIRILLIEKKIIRFLNEYLEKKEEDKNDTKSMSSFSAYNFLSEPLWG